MTVFVVACHRVTPSHKKISLLRCTTCFSAISALDQSWTTFSLKCKDCRLNLLYVSVSKRSPIQCQKQINKRTEKQHDNLQKKNQEIFQAFFCSRRVAGDKQRCHT